jgi:hypothetical protein
MGVAIAIVAHKDVFDTLWMLFGAEKPDFQTAEMRIVILKRSKGLGLGPKTDDSDLCIPCTAPEQAYRISLDDVHF